MNNLDNIDMEMVKAKLGPLSVVHKKLGDLIEQAKSELKADNQNITNDLTVAKITTVNIKDYKSTDLAEIEALKRKLKSFQKVETGEIQKKMSIVSTHEGDVIANKELSQLFEDMLI